MFKFQSQISDDDGTIRFKRSKIGHTSSYSKINKYMLRDEDTDDEDDTYKIPSEDDYDGVWVNVNDLPEPFYPLKEYKPNCILPNIIEDSPTGCFYNICKIQFIYVPIHI